VATVKPFTSAAAVILAAIAVVHVLRLIYGWQVTVVDGVVPMWVSAVGAVVAGLLAIMIWREQRRP
jgi:hypothetical protein